MRVDQPVKLDPVQVPSTTEAQPRLEPAIVPEASDEHKAIAEALVDSGGLPSAPNNGGTRHFDTIASIMSRGPVPFDMEKLLGASNPLLRQYAAVSFPKILAACADAGIVD